MEADISKIHDESQASVAPGRFGASRKVRRRCHASGQARLSPRTKRPFALAVEVERPHAAPLILAIEVEVDCSAARRATSAREHVLAIEVKGPHAALGGPPCATSGPRAREHVLSPLRQPCAKRAPRAGGQARALRRPATPRAPRARLDRGALCPRSAHPPSRTRDLLEVRRRVDARPTASEKARRARDHSPRRRGPRPLRLTPLAPPQPRFRSASSPSRSGAPPRPLAMALTPAPAPRRLGGHRPAGARCHHPAGTRTPRWRWRPHPRVRCSSSKSWRGWGARSRPGPPCTLPHRTRAFVRVRPALA